MPQPKNHTDDKPSWAKPPRLDVPAPDPIKGKKKGNKGKSGPGGKPKRRHEYVDEETSAARRANMIPGPKGGMLTRANVGNRARTLTSARVRAAMLELVERHLPFVGEVMANPEARDADKIRALDTLARYAMGTRQEVVGADGASLFPLVIREVGEPTAGGAPVSQEEAAAALSPPGEEEGA